VVCFVTGDIVHDKILEGELALTIFHQIANQSRKLDHLSQSLIFLLYT